MNLKNYVIGFVLSLALTGLSFGAVWLHYYNHHSWPTHPELFVWILALALVQLAVQVIFFLHLGRVGGAAKLNLAVLALAATLVFIVVGGSLWIMTSLNSRMMPGPDQMMQYMQDQDAAM
ncbi:MAG: cytochrome o ubiquinol oxidase subunit IV [Chthoniobacterales bacterium]